MLLLVANAKKRRFKDKHASVRDELAVEPHEERRQEHPNMQTVHIGVSREDDAPITQMVERLFNVERLDEIVELLVSVKDFLVQSACVQRLALQEEDGLIHRVARRSQRTAG